MSAEETLEIDDKAASIWHVDRTARVTQLISGDPKATRALVLVRDNGRNSDFIEIDGTTHPEFNSRVSSVEAAGPRGWEEGAGAKVDATVIMCTVGSCDMLEDAVRAILAQKHHRFSLVVVDNAPETGQTREKLASIDDTRMTIVPASRPGLSRARNRGVLAARGEVIVFTDDDAIVDPNWLTAMIDPFTASPYVAATTGIALPLEERYKPQRWFESRGGFPKDMKPRVWAAGDIPEGLEALGDKGEGGPLFPITTAPACAWLCAVTSSWRSAPSIPLSAPAPPRAAAKTSTCSRASWPRATSSCTRPTLSSTTVTASTRPAWTSRSAATVPAWLPC